MPSAVEKDLQVLWETAQEEVCLEGSNGCTLKHLWKLVGLEESSADTPDESIAATPADEVTNSLKLWLWSTFVSRRGREIQLATFDGAGDATSLQRGVDADLLLASYKDLTTLKENQTRVGVIASQAMRLRTLGLASTNIKSVTGSPTYIQVLEVVGQFREYGADIEDVLQNVNKLNKSSKRNSYANMTGRQPFRDPTSVAVTVQDSNPAPHETMTASQLYPIYDRLTKAGLLHKSIVQRPHAGLIGDESIGRFTVLYLMRFKDSIKVPEGSRLEPTAKEEFLELLLEYIAEGGGEPGTVMPWYEVRKALFPRKRVAQRVKNYLQKETNKPEFPIKLQMLDVRAMDYQSTGRVRKAEPCISLKPSAEFEAGAPEIPVGLGVFRAVVGFIKSRGARGSTLELIRGKLGLGNKIAAKVADIILAQPNVYGIWKGYTRVGRSAKVQAFFYNADLTQTDSIRVTSGVALDVPKVSADRAERKESQNAPHPEQGLVPSALESQPTLLRDKARSESAKDSVGQESMSQEAASSSDRSPLSSANVEKDTGPHVVAASTADVTAGDRLCWDGEDELDALLDLVDMEMEGSKGTEELPEAMVEARVNFMLKPVFPAEGTSTAELSEWSLLDPNEKRKRIILAELEIHKAVTLAKLGQLIRLVERGPSLHKSTLSNLANSLVNEEKAKRITAPPPIGVTLYKSFATGDMLVHKNSPTDPVSMRAYAERFHRLEAEVARRIADTQGAYRPSASSRFLVHKQLVHRTMIFHRELLRSLPELVGQKGGSRIIDLDRLVLDIPISVFLTMFGYPPDGLYSDDLSKQLRKAESLKLTIRQAPRDIWQMLRTGHWYKGPLLSSIEALDHMKVLTKIDTPTKTTRKKLADTIASGGGADFSSALDDKFAYSHVSAAQASAMGIGQAPEQTDAKHPSTLLPNHGSSSEGLVHGQMPLSAAHLLGANVKRGQRRDKKARSRAAEHVLVMKNPPEELKMGLGWGCLHVDLAVYTQDPTKAERKRVAGHLQWFDFWHTYKLCAVGRDDDNGNAITSGQGASSVPFDATCSTSDTPKREIHALAPWLISKVPELVDSSSWGVEEIDVREAFESSWNKARRQWTKAEDKLLIDTASSHAYDLRHGSRVGSSMRLASPEEAVFINKKVFTPVATALGKSTEACKRRYQRIVNYQAKAAEHIANTPSRLKRSRDVMDSPDEAAEAGGSREKQRPTKFRRGKGLLADGPQAFLDLDRGRRRAREQALLAKEAGFEWANEENSWQENDQGGGIRPRPFEQWWWTTDELAAYTAVRQILLVPEEKFSSEQAVTRLKSMRPPIVQKAYRVLVASGQAVVLQEAWNANNSVLQDAVDHEVYKMLGRHGVEMATRGIAASKAMQVFASSEAKWTRTIANLDNEPEDNLEAFKARLASRTNRSATDTDEQLPSLRDAALYSDRMDVLLEAVAGGLIGFTVTPVAETGIMNSTPDGSVKDISDAGNDVGKASTRHIEEEGGNAVIDNVTLEAARVRHSTVDTGSQHVSANASACRDAATEVKEDNKSHTNGSTAKFKVNKMIDEDITAAMRSELSRMSQSSGAGDGYVPQSCQKQEGSMASLLSVQGYEESRGIEQGVNESTKHALEETIISARNIGLTLDELCGKALGTVADSTNVESTQEAVKSSLSKLVGDGEVIRICGMYETRFMSVRYGELWIVPDESTTSALTMQKRSDIDGISLPASHGANDRATTEWRPRQVQSTTAAPNHVTWHQESFTHEESAILKPRPSVWLPWMTLAGGVDARLLNRLRQALVSHVKRYPGCTSKDVRKVECPFLTEGEVLLLLRDLTRRGVLHEHAGFIATEVNLRNGWGNLHRDICRTTTLALDSKEIRSEEAGRAAAFTLRIGWVNIMRTLVGGT